MKVSLRCLAGIACMVVLSQCETLETSGSATTGVGTSGTITVEGTSFYPDETGVTFIVPAGAQVIGAGGTNCRYLVQEGGSLTAHSGRGNVYEIKSGGHFRGFAHPATSSTVTYEPGATIEQEESGPETRFVVRS